MQDHSGEDREGSLVRFLEAGEVVRAATRARDTVLALTDRRLIVATNERVALDVPIEGVRRVQFDIERARPATLVIVPDHHADEPQILTITPEEYGTAASALAVLGARLAQLDHGERTHG